MKYTGAWRDPADSNMQAIWSGTTEAYYVIICDNIDHFELSYKYHVHFFNKIGDQMQQTIDASAVTTDRKKQIWYIMDLLNSDLYAGIDPSEFCYEILG